MKEKIEIIKPEHRCKKCKTPLIFKQNYIRTEEEIDKIYAKKFNKMSFWKKITTNKYDYWIDQNRQYWECPKCFEKYLISLKNEKS